MLHEGMVRVRLGLGFSACICVSIRVSLWKGKKRESQGRGQGGRANTLLSRAGTGVPGHHLSHCAFVARSALHTCMQWCCCVCHARSWWHPASAHALQDMHIQHLLLVAGSKEAAEAQQLQECSTAAQGAYQPVASDPESGHVQQTCVDSSCSAGKQLDKQLPITSTTDSVQQHVPASGIANWLRESSNLVHTPTGAQTKLPSALIIVVIGVVITMIANPHTLSQLRVSVQQPAPQHCAPSCKQPLPIFCLARAASVPNVDSMHSLICAAAIYTPACAAC
jgi:hypothetical protein